MFVTVSPRSLVFSLNSFNSTNFYRIEKSKFNFDSGSVLLYCMSKKSCQIFIVYAIYKKDKTSRTYS